MTDVIADMLTRIRNGQQRKLVSVSVPYSGFKEQILKVMQEEGYIKSYKKQPLSKGAGSSKVGDSLEVNLKYLRDATPVIQEIQKISKPGKRLYTRISDLQGCYNDLGVVILSTPKGVMSDSQAKKEKVGGEIICQLF